MTTLARPQERAAQASHTELLMRCRPELRAVPGWDAPGLSPPAIEHATGLAAELGVPLLGLAAGPGGDARVWALR
jgi:hypothetical protein